jgi:hypothetical protein
VNLLKSSLGAMLVMLALSSTASAKPGDKSAKNTSDSAPVKLFGHIDELSYLCSSSGIRLSKAQFPAKVDKISLGSAAAYSGLRTGDDVLSAKYDDNSITFDIKRNGRPYQARVATNVKGVKEEFESRKIKFSIADSAFDKELKKLQDVHVVILVDRSLSMGDMHAGVPGDLSKWMWTKEQVDNLFLATDRVLEGGFDIYAFNDKVEGRTGVTLWDLRQVFDRLKPAGEHKNIALPLQNVLNDYFSRRKPDSKPCLIVVLTDGTENTGSPLQEVLIDASKKMNRQGEVIIDFLQIGESIAGEELFDDLEQNLVAKGARYNMVVYKPFSELRNRGVVYEMLSSVKSISKAPKSTGAP